MKFKEWFFENRKVLYIENKELLNWAKNIEPDDFDQLPIFADALEELGYPNIAAFRDAIERLRVATEDQEMSGGGSYLGVYWEIRQRVIRLLTEAHHWVARHIYGVPWIGKFEK